MSRSLRIGIDLSITRVNQAGTAVYARNLASTLKHQAGPDEIHTFAVQQVRDMSAPKTLRTRLDTIYRDLFWTHVILPRLANQARLDVLLMPANVSPFFIPCQTVVSILDTTIFQTPEFFPRWQRAYQRRFVRLSANRSAKVLTISKNSKADICTWLGIPPHKVTVTYLAADAQFKLLNNAEKQAIRQKYNLSSFVFTVGTLEPRKNIARLIQAMTSLWAQGVDLPLVHAGPHGWYYDNLLADISRLNIENRVRFLGFVPLQDLVALYNAATIFVYPSLYEGFGIPVLEAMSCGCPVITSNLSSLPEIVDGAGILVDPYQPDAIAQAIHSLVDDTEKADTLRRLGLERARHFTWTKCAVETLEVCHQLFETQSSQT